MYSDTEFNTPACADGCGDLPSCAPLAFPYVPFQPGCSKRYGQNEALSNGTLFPGLNLPFHMKEKPGKIVDTPLSELQALEFVLLELGLYLDTHQGDKEAFALFQQYAALEKKGREKYEAARGPLFQSSAAKNDCFCGWIQDPWPWNISEKEG